MMNLKKMIPFLSLLTLGILFMNFSSAQEIKVPEIFTLPQLSEDLAPGTLAWAYPDQLHLSQPQTGHAEVHFKYENFKALFGQENNKQIHFSEELYQSLFTKSIAPVVISPRFEEKKSQSFLLDRTHTTEALSKLYREILGESGLRTAAMDHQGRPINIILVRVTENLSKNQMSRDEFSKYMVDHKYCYLKNFVMLKDAKTLISEIPFSQLPEAPGKTTNNPFRSFVWALQQENILEKSGTDFDEFRIAEIFVEQDVVRWPEISGDRKSHEYQKAIEKAKLFLKSALGIQLIGSHDDPRKMSCKSLF
jgi:hypothetical protein